MGNYMASHCDWLKLKAVCGMTTMLYIKLLRRFGGPAQVLAAGYEELMQVEGMKSAVARNIVQGGFDFLLNRYQAAMEELGARLVTKEDEEYPPLLRHIAMAPPLLFVQGGLWSCHGPMVSVVGTRRPTAYGRHVALQFGRDLALAGAGVVSGLARGIDSITQKEVLKNGGYTAGVLACSLDNPYPPENKDLIKEIAQTGAIISEYLIDMPPKAGLFSARNRIISGISGIVLVVEAAPRSGSLITVRHALEQGREVLAAPGPITSIYSRGCNELIRQGAGLIMNISELWEHYSYLPQPLTVMPAAGGVKKTLPLSPECEMILDMLGVEPVHIDDIIRESKLSPPTVIALLSELELAGAVDLEPGQYYTKI
jgi:DNA processing protein